MMRRAKTLRSKISLRVTWFSIIYRLNRRENKSRFQAAKQAFLRR